MDPSTTVAKYLADCLFAINTTTHVAGYSFNLGIKSPYACHISYLIFHPSSTTPTYHPASLTTPNPNPTPTSHPPQPHLPIPQQPPRQHLPTLRQLIHRLPLPRSLNLLSLFISQSWRLHFLTFIANICGFLCGGFDAGLIDGFPVFFDVFGGVGVLVGLGWIGFRDGGGGGLGIGGCWLLAVFGGGEVFGGGWKYLTVFRTLLGWVF